jgi:Tfp pilus assembly protein PilV
MKIAVKKHRTKAFSLMEVMIAIAVFFMAIFAILELTSRNLKMARALQQPLADPGAVAAMIALTNQLEDAASESGDLGPDHPEIQYTWTATEVSSNGLFQVDIVVNQVLSGRMVQSPLTVLMFRPQGAPQAGAAATGTRTTLPSTINQR